MQLKEADFFFIYILKSIDYYYIIKIKNILDIASLIFWYLINYFIKKPIVLIFFSKHLLLKIIKQKTLKKKKFY